MESATGLPMYSGPVDHLRYGLRSLESEMMTTHPVQSIDKPDKSILQNISKLQRVRKLYGSPLAMRLATESNELERPRRLPGLDGSTIGIDTVLGMDTTISFCDYLDDPSMRPEMPRMNVHSRMEIRLGLL